MMEKTDFEPVTNLGTGYQYRFHPLTAGNFSTLKEASDAHLKHKSSVLSIWHCLHQERGYFMLAEVMSEEFYMVTPYRSYD